MDAPPLGARVRFLDTDVWGKRTIPRTGRYLGRGFWGDHVIEVAGFVGPLTTRELPTLVEVPRA